jgi:hypothetical protein
MPKRQDLRALRNVIREVKTLLDTSPELPEGRTRCRAWCQGREGYGETRAGVLPEHCGYAKNASGRKTAEGLTAGGSVASNRL